MVLRLILIGYSVLERLYKYFSLATIFNVFTEKVR